MLFPFYMNLQVSLIQAIKFSLVSKVDDVMVASPIKVNNGL